MLQPKFDLHHHQLRRGPTVTFDIQACYTDTGLQLQLATLFADSTWDAGAYSCSSPIYETLAKGTARTLAQHRCYRTVCADRRLTSPADSVAALRCYAQHVLRTRCSQELLALDTTGDVMSTVLNTDIEGTGDGAEQPPLLSGVLSSWRCRRHRREGSKDANSAETKPGSSGNGFAAHRLLGSAQDPKT